MKRLKLVLLVMIIGCSVIPKAEAVVVYEDGKGHAIDFWIGDSVEVRNSDSGEPTGLCLVGEAYLSGAWLSVFEDSQIEIRGGRLSGYTIWMFGNSRVTIRGGWITSSMQLSDYPTVVLDGSNFMFDGQPVSYGTYPIPEGRVSGILADGIFYDQQYVHDELRGGALILVPEPASIILFGLGGIMFITRRKMN